MKYRYDLTILYVEDEKIVRESTREFFRQIFSEVVVAIDGRDGLKKYTQYHNNPRSIDLVITDITMPEMNGFEMIETMRKINKDLHVIMLSGLEFGKVINDINKISSLNQFIQKPLDHGNLLEILDFIIADIEDRNNYKKQYSLTQQYHNALDNSAIVTKTDKFGIITYANDAFCQISGYKLEELIGKSHNIVRDPSVPKEFFRNMWSVIQAKMIFKHASIPNKAKNGDIYFVDTTILPILDENRNIQEYISIRFNTTALEYQIRADQKALQSQEKFLANMSHEIRTPLNGILGFAKILEEQIKDPELKEYAEVINHSGKNLLLLINQILDLSKIQNGHMELDKTWFSLYSDITGIKKLFEINAVERKVNLSCTLCATTSDNLLQKVDILTDGLKLKQVISNLINNAIKFTPEGGEILFDVRRVGLTDKFIKLRFSVKDTGIGIAKEKQEKIFEPFTQADLSTTRDYGGTGLGLTLAKDFVSLFGSDLKLISEVGKGSEFYFEVEFEYRKHQLKTDLKVENFILLAEDVQINQKLTEILLKDIDLHIKVAENGLEALEIFQKGWRNIDAVLLDIKMPIMDGIEACKRINQFKEKENISNIPVIALTSDDTLKDKEKYLSLGFDLFISKPINEDILKSALKKPLRQNSLQNKNVNGEDETINEELEIKKLDDLQLSDELKKELLKGIKKETPQECEIETLQGTILVAEDVVINQKLIGIILKKFGLNTVFVNNGLEAVSYFMKEYTNINGVLLDINMPIMDGMEACSKIVLFKKTKSIKNIPIIALTANAISGDKERYLNMGFDEYIAKPIDNDTLFEVLKKYLNKSKQEKCIQHNLANEHNIELNFEKNAEKLSLPLDFYQELLSDFCKLLDKEVPLLNSAIKSKDTIAIKEIAHKLKGVAGNLAIDPLFRYFKSIEEELKSRNYSEIEMVFQEIEKIMKGLLCTK